MNRSVITVFCVVFVLAMLFAYPVQSNAVGEQSDSAAIRDKRWTFNTWRLHGRRQLFNS